MLQFVFVCVCVFLKAGLIYFCWTMLEQRVCDSMVNVGVSDCRLPFLLSGIVLLVQFLLVSS
jgi:hypothetical protein